LVTLLEALKPHLFDGVRLSHLLEVGRDIRTRQELVLFGSYPPCTAHDG